MQTFLPYDDFCRCARVLDDRRLGKQRVENLQILRAIHIDGYGWGRHPAVTMWRGHTAALVSYGVAIVDEWRSRGHRDSTFPKIAEFVHPGTARSQEELAGSGALPAWLGWQPLHRSHQSALVRKDPEHYRPHFPDAPDDLDYVWPRPPVPTRHQQTRSAWVVRTRTDDGCISIEARSDEHPWQPLAERSGRLTKRVRQVARFIEDMRPGDLVVVPDGERLRLATVRGHYEYHEGRHVRPVDEAGELPRDELDFPAALQDPQDVFTLNGEPLLDQHAEDGSRP